MPSPLCQTEALTSICNAKCVEVAQAGPQLGWVASGTSPRLGEFCLFWSRSVFFEYTVPREQDWGLQRCPGWDEPSQPPCLSACLDSVLLWLSLGSRRDHPFHQHWGLGISLSELSKLQSDRDDT